MTTRHDAPDPIGHACARALTGLSAPDSHYAGGCPYCRGLGFSGDDVWHEWETCERRQREAEPPWLNAGDPVDDLRAFAARVEREAREPLRRMQADPQLQRRLDGIRRIRAALDRDGREHVRQLLATSANWNPWQPVRSGRYARNVALRELSIRLARLTVATSAVWLVFAVWQAWH